jgi:hypothetical protein
MRAQTFVIFLLVKCERIFFKYIIENDLKVGFMIDESTTISIKEALVICLRCGLPESTDTSSFFFDSIELDNIRAAFTVEMFLSNLHSDGFEDEFLLRNWISFGYDGACNMLGRHAGVARFLVEKYPNLIVRHCSNHRLEIAMNDVAREMSAVCHVKIFFDKLYAVYSASPKNRAELESVALQLSIRLNAIGRWVSSSARPVRAVWKNYTALYKHFHEASVDQNRTSSERAKYAGLKRKISDANFVLNMGLMSDALTELEHLSLKLQDRKLHCQRLIV